MYYKLEDKKMSYLQKKMSEYKNFEEKLEKFYEGFADLRDGGLLDNFTSSLLDNIADKMYGDLDKKLEEITSLYNKDIHVDRILPYFEDNSEGLAIIYHKIADDEDLTYAIPFTLEPVTQGIDKFSKKAIEEVKRLVSRHVLKNLGVVDGEVDATFIDGCLEFTAKVVDVDEPFKLVFKIYKTVL